MVVSAEASASAPMMSVSPAMPSASALLPLAWPPMEKRAPESGERCALSKSASRSMCTFAPRSYCSSTHTSREVSTAVMAEQADTSMETSTLKLRYDSSEASLSPPSDSAPSDSPSPVSVARVRVVLAVRPAPFPLAPPFPFAPPPPLAGAAVLRDVRLSGAPSAASHEAASPFTM